MALELIWILPVAIGIALAAYFGISDFARTERDADKGSRD